MDPNSIKSWIVLVSSVVSVAPIVWGVVLALREYRLKLRAEIRLAETTQIENDIKLLTLFTQVMNIAHARAGSVVSEKVIELLLQPDLLNQLGKDGAPLEIKSLVSYAESLVSCAVVNLPVGLADLAERYLQELRASSTGREICG